MLDQELEYMYGLQRFGVKPGLKVMERLMVALGHPEKKFPSVHIAGTNGKGSVAAFLSAVLQAAGYKVGLYTSPHLIRFNERIQINGVDIPDVELVRLVAIVRQATEAADIQTTFFEFTTAVAFLYFAESRVDIAMIEVGMGGRLDATNVVAPLVAVITTIGLDHTEVLGETLEKVAAEKAGIIKPGVPVVIGEKKEEVIEYLRGEAKKKHARAVVVGEELRVGGVDASLSRQRFIVAGAVSGQFEIRLLGRHQVDNALMALTTIFHLRQAGIEIPDAAITDGLREARWDGRMQVVSRRPLIIVDGAHNEDGMEALYEFIKDFPRHSVLVVAQKRGKHIPLLSEKVVPLFTHVVATEGAYEPMPAEELAQQLQRASHNPPSAAIPQDSAANSESLGDVPPGMSSHDSEFSHEPGKFRNEKGYGTLSQRSAREVESVPQVEKAVERALKLLPSDGFLLVTGSLYMVGGALEVLRRRRLGE